MVIRIRIKPNDPLDYCRKIAGCEIGPEGSTCPLWLDFLNTVMGKNQEMIEYLRRVCGYCLTGLITEHVMFFLYGTGANGKSVFINTIRGIMGTYYVTAPVDTFTVTHGSSHPTDLAVTVHLPWVRQVPGGSLAVRLSGHTRRFL